MHLDLCRRDKSFPFDRGHPLLTYGPCHPSSGHLLDAQGAWTLDIYRIVVYNHSYPGLNRSRARRFGQAALAARREVVKVVVICRDLSPPPVDCPSHRESCLLCGILDGLVRTPFRTPHIARHRHSSMCFHPVCLLSFLALDTLTIDRILSYNLRQ